MLSRVIAKNVGDVFLRHSVDRTIKIHLYFCRQDVLLAQTLAKSCKSLGKFCKCCIVLYQNGCQFLRHSLHR